MRLSTILIAAAWISAAPAQAQADLDADGGFNERGVDRHDHTPDWNYRRGEAEGKGAYYDGGRYGPRGLLRGDALAPWLSEAVVAGRSPARANCWFAKLADRNRDARLTDEEIALALAEIGGRTR